MKKAPRTDSVGDLAGQAHAGELGLRLLERVRARVLRTATASPVELVLPLRP